MNDLSAVCLGMKVAILIGYVAVLVALLGTTRYPLRSTMGRGVRLYCALAGAGVVIFVAELMSVWWLPPWLELAMTVTATAVVLYAAYWLVRPVPVLCGAYDRDIWTAAAEELRQSKGRFDRALQGSSNGLWEWNVEANEMWIAPRFRELLGYESEEEFPSAIESWERALHPDDKERVLAALNGCLVRDGSFDIEYRLQTKNGEYRWFAARGLAIRHPDGSPYLMSGSIQDIHDRKSAEQTLRQMEEYTYHQHKMESLGELAGGIAHEFNNMLQAISGQVQWAERSLPPESSAKAELAIASTLIHQASQISRRLLAFSRREISDQRPIDPNDILTQLSAILRPMLNKEINLTIRRRRGLSQIVADPISLQQALLNLCINARDAMPHGGTLTLTVRCGTATPGAAACRASTCPPGKYIMFVVRDTGCGIPEEIRSKVCNPFFTTKSSGSGTGLGLAIACSIAKDHQGFIDVESEVGKGSTFTMGIPLATHSKKRRRRPHSADQKQRDRKRMRRLTVLYAEDEKYVRRNTIQLLRDLGCRVLVARDGAEALRQFEKYRQRIDLALLDVSMPEMNGVEVMWRLRESEPELPVIFCTAYAAALHAGKVLSEKDTYLLNKPFNAGTLGKSLQQAVAPALKNSRAIAGEVLGGLNV